MKKLMSILMMTILVVGTYPLMAQKKSQTPTPPQSTTPKEVEQPQKACGWLSIPNLTDQQKEQIKTLHNAHIRQTTILKNQLEEKKAQMNSATSWASYNAANAEKLLDDIYSIKLQLAKEKLSFHNAVRNLLNDDQKIYWDKKFNINSPAKSMTQGCNQGCCNMQNCNHNCSQNNMGQACMHQQGAMKGHSESCNHGQMQKECNRN